MNDIFTKQGLILELIRISQKGWVKNNRPGNDGGVGNTLEDLLGIEENNLPLANAAEWELKSHRANSTSRITGYHSEPSPRGASIVANVLLPYYGWPHQKAGNKYPQTERSFRVTLKSSFNERGFRVKVNWDEQKLEMEFDSTKVDPKHNDWLQSVISARGPGNINPVPYWGFRDLECTIGAKLTNCFLAIAEHKKIDNIEYYNYSTILMLKDFSFELFLKGIENGDVVIEFDARTGHNHGTKFRWQENVVPKLYKTVTPIVQNGEILIDPSGY